MATFKYIIMRVGDREVPIIFPDRMIHSIVAHAMKFYFATEVQATSNNTMSAETIKQVMDDIVPVSAGTIELHAITTHGKSETLKLESRPEDERLIVMYNYEHGVIWGEEDE